MKIVLTISYDGTNYKGWQIQPAENTIQHNIEEVLSIVYKRQVAVLGASRTDTGVHAFAQRAVFEIDGNDLKIPVNKLPVILNNILPMDIVVTDAEAVSDDFNPIRDAKNKTYLYRIFNGEYMNPLKRNFLYHYRRNNLDVELMKKGAFHFIGTHDFKAFCSTGGNAKTTVRNIFMLDIGRTNDIISIEVKGDGFLYNMVRIIVGTLIEVGSGRIEPDCVAKIIRIGDRKNAGETAPSNGLVLLDIKY